MRSRTSISLAALALATLAPNPVTAQQAFWAKEHGDFEGPTSIQKADSNGSNFSTLFNNEATLRDCQVDAAAQKVYWVDYDIHGLMRSHMSGGINPETVIGGLSTYKAIHMDFHFDVGLAYFMQCAPAGCSLHELSLETGVATLMTEIDGESSLPKVDIAAGLVYWVEYLGTAGNPPSAIKRANLDGSNQVTVHTENAAHIGSLQLDRAGGKIYWGTYSSGTRFIRRMNTDGTAVENLASAPLIHPIFVDSAEGKLYWFQHTEWHTDTQLYRANLDGSNAEPLTSVGAGICNSLFVIPERPSAVPTLSAWGAIVLTISLVIMGVIILRQRGEFTRGT